MGEFVPGSSAPSKFGDIEGGHITLVKAKSVIPYWQSYYIQALLSTIIPLNIKYPQS